MGLMTCRVCGECGTNPRDFVKYGIRHYAHHECFLKAGKSLDDLRDWQVEQFPVLVLRRHGLLDSVKERLRKNE